MVNSEYNVILDNGNEYRKKFIAGNVVRVHEDEGRPLSFDLAINKGKNRDAEFVNFICVSDKSKMADLVRKFVPGQQLFCEINMTTTEKNGQEYTNLWLYSFEYGKSPKNSNN